MREMVPRRSPNASDERRAGAEGKNRRSEETLPRSKEVDTSGKFPLSLIIFHENSFSRILAILSEAA